LTTTGGIKEEEKEETEEEGESEAHEIKANKSSNTNNYHCGFPATILDDYLILKGHKKQIESLPVVVFFQSIKIPPPIHKLFCISLPNVKVAFYYATNNIVLPVAIKLIYYFLIC
jgi:hypothetical protein